MTERDLLRAREEERHSLATELHDGVCQDLFATAIAARSVQLWLEEEGNPLAASVELIGKSVSAAADQLRQMVHGMIPFVLDGNELARELRILAVRTAEMHPLGCHVECASPVSLNCPEVSTQLYRIAREAIRNSAIHSGATRIEIRLSQTNGEIHLAVQDNGRGLPPDVQNRPGFGLRGMTHRAGLIQAQLSIRNGERGGTEVICRVPRPGPRKRSPSRNGKAPQPVAKS